MLVLAATFLALALPGIGTRGLIAEEIQAYLTRHPLVLERSPEGVQPMPPYEPNAPPRPRWVTSSQWPTRAYDGVQRQWPVSMTGYESALGAYPGILLGPLLGGGVAGMRLANVLMGLGIVLLTWRLALAVGVQIPLVAGLLTATSFGMLFIARTGLGFELPCRLAMLGALILAVPAKTSAPAENPSRIRVLGIGLLGGIAVVCRATIGVALVPALAGLQGVRWPSRKMLAATGLLIVGVPLATYALLQAWVPLRAETTPLYGFPWHDLPRRLLGAPGYVALHSAWLGNAATVYAPIVRGEPSLPIQPLWAAFGALPLVTALYLQARGQAGPGSRMYLLGFLATALAAAALYGRPIEFQLALPLEPLWAIAVAEQLGKIRRPAVATASLALVLGLRLTGSLQGLDLDRHVANPMLSGRCQHAAVQWLRDHGEDGSHLITTTYNQAGVLEGWTDGAIRPIHAWAAVKAGSHADPEVAWRAILRTYHPKYVLLAVGANPYELAGVEAELMGATLQRSAAEVGQKVSIEATFPTEAGTPGWVLVRLH